MNEEIIYIINTTILLLTLCINIILGILVLLKNKQASLNRYFSFFLFALALWNFSRLLTDSFSSSFDPLFWTKFALVGPILVTYLFPLFALHFVREVVETKCKVLLALFPLALLFFVPTSANVQFAASIPYGVKWTPGWLYIGFSIYFIFAIGYSIFLFIKKYYYTDLAVQKMQIRYICIGSVTTAGVGIVTSAIFPLLHIFQYYNFGPPASLIFSLSVTYAILRTRFLDIKVTFQNSVARILASVIALGIIGVGIAWLSFLFVAFHVFSIMSLLFLSIFLTAFLFERIYLWLLPIFLSVFSPKVFYSQERLNEIRWWATMTQKPTMQEVYGKIHEELSSYFSFAREKEVQIFLYDFKEKRYYLVYPSLDYEKVFIQTDTCISYELERDITTIRVADELLYIAETSDWQKKRCEKIIEELTKLKAKVLVPLGNSPIPRDVIGFIALGAKSGREPYTTNDVEYLRKLARVVTPALVNAMMRTGWEAQRRKMEEMMKMKKSSQKMSRLKLRGK